MGGHATRVASQQGIPSAVKATEQSQMVPALLLDMPDDFEVKFTPRYPLGVGYPLLMRVRRMHGRVSKNSLRFHSGATVDKGPRVRCRTMSCANGCPRKSTARSSSGFLLWWRIVRTIRESRTFRRPNCSHDPNARAVPGPSGRENLIQRWGGLTARSFGGSRCGLSSIDRPQKI